MRTQPTILVIGATGAQGGSVARHLLRRGRYMVRALARRPESPRASALRAKGAEVVAGDLDDVGSLRAAMSSCVGVFGVTSSRGGVADEYRQGVNLLDAAAEACVEHLIFSSQPHYGRRSGGALEVPHFDTKAELEDHARGLCLPATFLHVALTYESFLALFPPRPQSDGSYRFGFPQGETRLATVSDEDVGGVVAPIFERRASFLGRTVGVVGDDLPAASYARLMSEATGLPVRYQHIPRDIFAGVDIPGAEGLANMFEFQRLYIPDRQADRRASLALYPEMQTFAQWLGANAERLRAAW